MNQIKSMTGYGTAEINTLNYTFKAEIRSLNGKFFDCSIRLPKELRDKETEIRQWATAQIARGTVQINIQKESFANNTTQDNFQINENLALSYHKKLKSLVETLKVPDQYLLQYILAMPEVTSFEISDNTEDWKNAQSVLEHAFIKFNQFRQQEGQATANNLSLCINAIQKHLNLVVAVDIERKSHIQNKLEQAVSEIKDRVSFDSGRFEQELMFYLEKADIGEEIQRLQNHLEYFLETMDGESSGKKLGFIAQEIGREINTMGSKANYFAMQKHVVEMKDQLEKIKEQCLNLI